MKPITNKDFVPKYTIRTLGLISLRITKEMKRLHLGGLSLSEIAQLYKCAPANVRTRIHYKRKKRLPKPE